MKNNKGIVTVLILLGMSVLTILIYRMVSIYAIFQSDVEANVKFKNGVWNIEVNGTKISTGIQKDFVIDKIDIEEDEHTMPGKISPGLSGKFKIAINPENTNVSMRYDITLNQEELKNGSITIKSVEETANGAKLIKTGENIYTGIITLEDIQKGVAHEIEMRVEWNDDEQNNKIDTKLGTNKEVRQFQIPVTFRAIQYSGEEIVPAT